MAKRHKPPESVHPNRWMVSYADLMTLLFAFFVVLYATSTINQEKFEQMSQVFMGVFDQPAALGLSRNIETFVSEFRDSFQIETVSTKPALAIGDLQKSINELIVKTLKIDALPVLQLDDAIQLTLPADRIFVGRNAQISIDGEYFLSEFSKVLRDRDFFLLIEILNDDQGGEENPWLLGSLQAMAIKQMLVLDEVSPLHLASVNYGPFQPVATNDDEEGQALNRRINFVIYDNLKPFERLKTLAEEKKSANP